MEGEVQMEIGKKKKWCCRYLKLINNLLYIYKYKKDGLLLVLDLSTVYEISLCLSSSKPFSFYIESNDYYKFSVESEEKRNEWIFKLQEAQNLQNSKKINLNDFKIIKELGNGIFGKVYLVQQKNNNNLYALKAISKKIVSDCNLIEKTIAERNVLITSNHPFILSAKYTFQSETHLFLVTDYMPGGNLYTRLLIVKKFTLDYIQFYSAQIALAIGYLHEKDVIHRDLKLENILINQDGYLKLADFGLVKSNMIENETTRTFCGTPEFTAPEMILNKPYHKSIDWWAFGCLVFEMATGFPPFTGDNNRMLFESIIKNPVLYPNDMDNDLFDLLSKLLVKEPKERLGSGKMDFFDIISHPFFKSLNILDLSNKLIPAKWKPDPQIDLSSSQSNEIDISQDFSEQFSLSVQDIFNGFSYAKDWE